MKFFALAAGLLLAVPLFAQEATPSPTAGTTPLPTVEATPAQPVTLGEMVVHGTAIGLAVKELSGEELQSVHDTGNLGTALDKQSGLETQGEGMGKAWNTLSIRGQSFRETTVLVNGQRVPESFNLGTIPTESIERVEVIEGPQALAYGSDALGGLINIITRKPEDATGDLSAGGGDFNTYQFQAQTPAFGDKDFKNTLSGSWFTTDGYLPPVVDPASGVTYGFTDETHWDVSQSSSLKIGGGDALFSTSFFRQIGSAPDADNVIAAGTDQYDLDGRQDAWGLQSLLKADQQLGGWHMVLSLSGNYSDVLRSNPIGADPTSGVYNPYHNQYLDYAEQAYFSGAFDNFLTQVTLGADGHNEQIWSGLYGDYSRWTTAFVASGTLQFDPTVHLDWSNRLEYYSANTQVDNPSATLIFSPSNDWQFHAGAGKGYKLPSFDELYLPYTSFAALPPALEAQFSASPFASAWAGDKGNPTLLPEQCIDTEVGIEGKLGGLVLQMSGFANFYQNLINPAVDPTDNFWTYFNLPQALFLGTEDSLQLPLADWLEPRVSATYISATDQNGNPIQGRLRLKLAGGVELKPEKEWSMDIEAHYVDRNPVDVQYLTDLGFPAPPTDYWDMGLGVNYKVSEHLKGFFNVENVLNSQMASFQGIPLPGRYFEGGLTGMF